MVAGVGVPQLRFELLRQIRKSAFTQMMEKALLEGEDVDVPIDIPELRCDLRFVCRHAHEHERFSGLPIVRPHAVF